ncbi:hypothetical protein [Legionella longbeachae]|uniref:Putative coiled-coil protein n=1 Tax=Legionella longbeachae serogroup 1 (strain NSW150) TaxID=661367 RepID=D3HIV7_LEGLN|nr:hypothetical protein [Legionella longbeachae]VEE02845.1 coiled-coil protein [Legionella oakridgensis]HBD7398020.1 hypothetical protein [Legionella pneumophila]ARB90911.1 hypothetical protein A6J40_01295 [Legionella longbeachae]ARM32657.1 hypothetical protein B0B39_03615 [Legionella longbeachae]EEZ94565.1 conserved hypothetical protein [Legionella longbeachae D-4968]
MPDFVTTNGHTQIIVPLTIMPHRHQALPTLTGSPFSYEAGTVLYGHYNMEYLLPGGDILRLIANHNQKTVQLMLFTHQPDLIQLLPGDRPSSLVANVISKIHRYCIRSASYNHPLTPIQEQKLKLANECIGSLKKLLKKERRLNNQDHEGHETLRRKVIEIVGLCSGQNRLLATSPLISEGYLGNVLYEAHKTAQHYSFNRVYPVSRQDQMDFSKIIKSNGGQQQKLPCLIWDSELHIGHNNKDLDDALRVICHYYKLPPASNLIDVPANRFAQLKTFFRKLWDDGHDWINYLAMDAKPEHKTEIQKRLDGVTLTQISPYYRFQGFPQQGYLDLKSLIYRLTNISSEPILAKDMQHAKKAISQHSHGSWAIIPNKELILIRLENKVVELRYFIHDKLFYPLPEGQDLYTLGQISKRHLYLPERASLKLKAFISRIPGFFNKFYKSMHQFIVRDLQDEFFNHIHETHIPKPAKQNSDEFNEGRVKIRNSLILALENKGLLTTGQTLEEFIKEQISKSPYIIARPKHPPSPHPYDNPMHRILGVIRHAAGFFIDISEQKPLIGTLAMAAYAYGGGAVLAPELLKSILTKLHLHGLIAGIEPTQKLAQWLSHGTIPEAISASAIYWQTTVAGGNLDKFFIEAISVLKEDPGEIAIIAALALGLGYGLTKLIPSLGEEMGDFPYTNYAALGGKGGAALYDTIMHPGDDWFLGTCKWLCKGFLTLGKLCISPFFEGYYYGFSNGFLKGWKKSGILLKSLSKQILAASIDFSLALLTIPLVELSALLIHVPFRGISILFIKTLAILGNISAPGELLIAFSTREPSENLIANFRFSPLYGFTWPFGHFSDNPFTNISINIIRALYLPPLQLAKNLAILPILDVISFSTRLFLTVLDPITRIMTFALGSVLITIGEAWDKSFGILFSASSKGIASACNWIDNKASAVKQTALSFIENQRGQLYHWAFAQEDLKLHSISDDAKYYCSDPRRYELIPHSNSHCLLYALLNTNNQSVFQNECHHNPSHYQELFSIKKSRKEKIINSKDQSISNCI